MPSQRKRKSSVSKRVLRQRRGLFNEDLRLWDRIPAVGREFGSPDFERLMAEDQRDRVGVFDPALKDPFQKAS